MIIEDKDLRAANKELKRLLLKTIKNKSGGRTSAGSKAAASPLKKRSGNLQRNINPVLTIKNNKLMLDMEVMKYYQYLDEGTKRIKHPWFLTEDFTSSRAFRDVIRSLMQKGLQGAVFNVTSKLQ